MYGKTAFATQADYDRARYVKAKADRTKYLPVDPITLLSAETLAYIAGLVDGEGSLYITPGGPQKNRTLYAMLVVAMTHRPVIEWLINTVQARPMQLHNHTNIRLHSHLRAQWRFQLFNKRAVLLARHLLPFLKVKHEQARLFTTFPIDSRIEPGVKIDRREINRIRSTIRDQVAALNHGPILRAA